MKSINKFPKSLLVLISLVLLSFIGWVDFSVDAEFRLAPFYMAVLIGVGFFLRIYWGIFFSVLATIFTTYPYIHQYGYLSQIEIWNMAIVLATNLIVLILIVRLKKAAGSVQLAREKDVLLRETHHRIANNLSNIIGLIKLKTITDPDAEHYLLPVEGRIQSMLSVHNKLYKNDPESKINMKQYCTELINSIKHTYGLQKGNIEISSECSTIHLPGTVAETIGLLTSELMINSIKYAFPDNRQGKISISLNFLKDENLYLLNFKDNGIGFDYTTDNASGHGIGLQLIQTFTKKLNGKLECLRNNGMQFSIKFAP